MKDSEEAIRYSLAFYESLRILWSNLEKRLSAHFTQDENLIRLFQDKLDGHGLIATIIFEYLHDVHPNQVKKLYPHERQIAKGVGFARN